MEENQNETVNENAEKKGMNPMMLVLGLGAILLLIGGVFAAMRGNNNTETNQAPIVNDQTAQNEDSGGTLGVIEDESEEADVKVINMEAGSYYFTPSEIRVNQGDTVRIVLNSVDMMHNIVIEEFDVESDVVPAGESTTVEFVADIAGEFEYYCGVGNHRQQGQVGTLIVE